MKKEQYGPEYKSHLLEQYKLYVEMADQVSERRMSMNKFFISVNTFLIAIVSLFSRDNPITFGLFAVIGLILSGAWYFHLRSYRQLNSGKFKVVHQMEALLPFACYDVEWQILKEGKKKETYWPLSHVETALPFAFGLLYFCFLVLAVYSFASGMPLPFEEAGEAVQDIIASQG